uniref:Glycine--tRNA ligase beta subunit n=1 Tax=uncultured Thiotrichaceae bacterium TaxID=298394 RepID=A0A6S6RVX9_9GAMM|nr:MAG: Glycyl-tRNA synthetase beta chain (EC [uncultured Thiotrichaceae bacterium]
MNTDFLVEIGTEELPPKALKKLSAAFTDGIRNGLKEAGIEAADIISYAAPRRLAVWVQQAPGRQEDKMVERKGPPVKAAFDAEGNPTKAGSSFAASCGVELADLDRQETPKGEWLMFRSNKEGQQTATLLPEIVNKSLAGLPIPKRMRWGDNEVEFVRPVHWVVMLADTDIIDGEVLGIKAGRESYGHRFHAPEAINITSPASYAEQLKAAYVSASFADRREMIREEVTKVSTGLGGTAIMPEELLEEVSALVEWPVAIAGKFEDKFLDVPQEALIYTMQGDQKYFGLTDADGKLMPNFITISNIESKDPSKVSEGNERVIRPRFSDAAFFWEQDKKHTMESRREKLKSVVFQQKLGTVHEKSERVAKLAEYIAQQLNADAALAVRAAQIAKCDLVTDMVFEFTDLQGTMGRYYALHDGENAEVAAAMEEQYLPRYAGDELPASSTGRVLALAERLDTLAGIFAIGMKPTGTKDPFALRRAALGVLRIMIEQKLPLDLADLLDKATQNLSDKLDNAPESTEVLAYTLERLRAYYQDQGIGAELVEAVAALSPTQPLDFDQRIKAVAAFRELTASESLAAANKRISNILRKVESAIPESVNADLLQEDAEKALASAVSAQQEKVVPLFAAGDYEAALLSLAELREPVDQFFDGVMVMADDEALKNNRLALLNELRGLFLRVADLSVL